MPGCLVGRFDPRGVHEGTPSIAGAGRESRGRPKTLILPWQCGNYQGVAGKGDGLRGASWAGRSRNVAATAHCSLPALGTYVHRGDESQSPFSTESAFTAGVDSGKLPALICREVVRWPAPFPGPMLGSHGWGTPHVQQPVSAPAMAQVGKMSRSGLGRLPALDRLQPLPARPAALGARSPRQAHHARPAQPGRGGNAAVLVGQRLFGAPAPSKPQTMADFVGQPRPS